MLEPKHNQAIREEIGDRLRFHLAREQSDHLPALLRKLLARFEKTEPGETIAPNRKRWPLTLAPRGGKWF